MQLADKYTKMKVRTNADTLKDATVARNFGVARIGLCRMEHMFFEGERIRAMREMILAEDETGRKKALAKLLPMQKTDFEGIYTAMNGFPVTIRLLDPFMEFVRQEESAQRILPKNWEFLWKKLKHVASLHN